jgi:hypothetical protein
MTTNTDSRAKLFTGVASAVNQPHLLSVLVGSGERAAGRKHVRESKMRQFGELEAVIMDRLWEWG